MSEWVFAIAAALFVYSFFRMSTRLWQFLSYDETFGSAPNISIDDLVSLTVAADRDLPAFTAMIPAWNETETIAATIRHLADANYPASLFDINVITYADEPPGPDGRTTCDVAGRVAAEINAMAGRDRIRVERVPTGFDGFFPGEFDTGERHVGKARGLNYALRRLHERIMADERSFVLGRCAGLGPVTLPPETPETPAFLRRVAAEAEARPSDALAAHAADRMADLARTRPHLAAQLAGATDPGRIAELAGRMNPRWVAVFDADADAHPDLFRHLAARILEDPTVMGFQGPVAPLANFDAVHPLCGMAGLWIAFSHATGFPRLMTRPEWARPLAGTNFCLRIDGYEADGRLTGEPIHAAAPRRILLNFDPRYLTEDLEVAVRLYRDWRITTEWHPLVEWEQAPPRPGDLIGQWSRWTLGTLQVVKTMLRSNLPWRQRLQMAFVPFEIVATGLGPALTIVLWIIILSAGIDLDPALRPLTLFLTGVNVLYAAPFILTRIRFRRLRRITLAGQALLSMGREPAGMTDLADSAGIERLVDGIGLRDGSEFVRLARDYLDTRCLDREQPDRPPLARAYIADSPGAIDHAGCAELLDAIEDKQLKRAPGPDFRTILDVAHTMIWALPFLLFQLIPFYNGFAKWLLGTDRGWTKTARTPKT